MSMDGVAIAGEKDEVVSLTCRETLEDLSSSASLGSSSGEHWAEFGVNDEVVVEESSSALLNELQQNQFVPNGQDKEEATPMEEAAPKESTEANDQSCTTDQADQQREESEAKPDPKFAARQRVYARDEVTGLLYEAVVRRVMWGPKSRQLNVHLVQDPDQVPLPGESDDEDEEPDWCWHYFVHYQGWNTKWDRWVEESSLFEVSEGNKKLADRLKAELKEMKKLRKVGRGAKDSDVVAVRRRMLQLEEERREEERKEELRKQGVLVEEDDTKEEHTKMDPEEDEETKKAYELFSTEFLSKFTEENPNATPEEINKLIVEKWRNLEKDEREQYRKQCKECEEAAETNSSEANGEKVVRRRRRKLMRKAELEKERKLRHRDLEGKRKQAHAEKITIPFALKKILVDEWEIVSQCQMVPNLPSNVPVKVALDRYLQSKLDVIRQKHKEDEKVVLSDAKDDSTKQIKSARDHEIRTNDKEPRAIDGIKISADQGRGVDAVEEENIEEQEGPSISEQGKEWIDMVEGIAQYFDEALPVRILYWQELGQHMAFMRAKGGELKSKRKCDVYGCEYLLRLFVKFPSLLEDSDIPEAQKRHIYAKIGDLVRFLQKHQDEFFVQSYRKPEKSEFMTKKQGSNRKPRTTKASASSTATENSTTEEVEEYDVESADAETTSRFGTAVRRKRPDSAKKRNARGRGASASAQSNSCHNEGGQKMVSQNRDGENARCSKRKSFTCATTRAKRKRS